MADRFPLILNTSANQIQEIASGDQLDLSGNNIANAGIITASSFSGPVVASGIITAVAADIDDFVDVGSNIQLGNAGVITATTFKGDGDFVELDVDGHTNLDNVSVSGVSTFSNAVKLEGGYGNLEVGGNTGITIKGANPRLIFTDTDHNPDFSIRGNGGQLRIVSDTHVSERLIVDANGNFDIVKNVDVRGDLDVDGHTNLDNVSVAGVSTFTGNADFSAGIDVTGTITGTSHVDLPDAAEIKLGDNDEFLIYHTATGTSYIKETGSGDLYIDATNIRLRSQNGNEKLATTSTGVSMTGNATVSGNLSVGGVLTYEDVTNVDSVGIVTARDNIRIITDSKKLEIGAGQDLELFHNGSNTYITNNTGYMVISSENGSTYNDANSHYFRTADSSEYMAKFLINGAVELYHNNAKKLETRSNGITVTGYTYSDGVTIGNGTAYKYLAGSGNQLQMYHTGGSGNGYINNTQGTLLIGGPVVSFTNQANNAFLIRAVDGGTAELYFNANKKLETTNTGVTVTGTLAATAVTGDGSGLTGISIGISTEQVTPSSNVATLDLTKDDHKIVASGTYTITCTGGTEADNHTLRIENSGKANVGFSSYFKFPSGGTPSLPTTNGAISLISFTVHKVGSVGIATVLLSGASVNYS